MDKTYSDVRRESPTACCLGQPPHPLHDEEIICSICGALAAGAILMIVAIGYWRPALEPIDYPTIARAIQLEYGDRDIALYEDENLPICFYTARTLPFYATRDELLEALSRNPKLLIIWEQQRITEMPPPGKEISRIHMRKRDIVIYEQK